MLKTPTIAQVAAKAGVSQATVSRVLNQPEIVKPELIAKVNRAIKDLDYRPNRHARALGGYSTSTVGLILFDELKMFFSNPFWGTAMNAIYDSLLKNNLECNLIAQSSKLPTLAHTADVDSYSEFLRTRNVDGFIVVGHPSIDNEESFEKCNIPVVMWGRPLSKKSKLTFIESDNYAGAVLAMEHLIKKKRKHIAIIAGRRDAPVTADRLHGYVDTLKKNRLPFDDSLVVHGDFSRNSGREAMRTLLGRNKAIDAVFASNDEMALGALEVLKEKKIDVPGKISVIGYDNVDADDEAHKFLSTVSMDFNQIGTDIVAALVMRMSGQAYKSHLVPCTLVPRKST